VIEQRAQVVAVATGRVWVATQRTGDCGGSGACATAALGRLWNRRDPAPLCVPTGLPLQPGDEVMLAIAEHALLQGALRVYLLSLIALLLGALAGPLADRWRAGRWQAVVLERPYLPTQDYAATTWP
jgi:positive regulator of sigma E activity